MIIWTTTNTKSEAYEVRDELVTDHFFYRCDIFIEER